MDSVIVLCFVVCFYVHSGFAIILMGMKELAAEFVFLVSRDSCMALSRAATGLSAVCDCGIS